MWKRIVDNLKKKKTEKDADRENRRKTHHNMPVIAHHYPSTPLEKTTNTNSTTKTNTKTTSTTNKKQKQTNTKTKTTTNT